MGRRVPPVSVVSPIREAIFVLKEWPREMKDVEKGIIIERVDRCSTWSVVNKPCLFGSQ